MTSFPSAQKRRRGGWKVGGGGAGEFSLERNGNFFLFFSGKGRFLRAELAGNLSGKRPGLPFPAAIFISDNRGRHCPRQPWYFVVIRTGKPICLKFDQPDHELEENYFSECPWTRIWGFIYEINGYFLGKKTQLINIIGFPLFLLFFLLRPSMTHLLLPLLVPPSGREPRRVDFPSATKKSRGETIQIKNFEILRDPESTFPSAGNAPLSSPAPLTPSPSASHGLSGANDPRASNALRELNRRTDVLPDRVFTRIPSWIIWTGRQFTRC